MFVYIMIVVIFFALYFIVPQKHSAIPCVLFVLAMAVMSYFVQPGETDDLARYFYIISQIERPGTRAFAKCWKATISISEAFRFAAITFISSAF